MIPVPAAAGKSIRSAVEENETVIAAMRCFV